MPAAEGLEPPVDSRKANPGALTLTEQSDSEDQFVDAQSSPLPFSPIPKAQASQDSNHTAQDEAPAMDAPASGADQTNADEKAVSHESPSDSVPEALVETPKPTADGNTEPAGPDSETLNGEQAPVTKPDVKVTGTDGVVEEVIPDASIGAESQTPSETPLTTEEADTPQIKDTAPGGNDEQSRNDEQSGGFAQSDFKMPGGFDESEDFEESGGFEESDGFDEPGKFEAPGGFGQPDNADHSGDDFDDFEEGGQEDDDFDDFDDGFQQAEPVPTPTQANMPVLPVLPFPVPDFKDLDSDEIMSSLDQYLTTLFPPEELDLPPLPSLPREPSAFITSRSASLWSQLVAPPPLAPPDWIRSRTRRLFLVSLGVPVDLDEILPASKQKKLVLPSLNLPSSSSPRTSHDSRSVSRLRQDDANNSSTSVDTQGKPRHRKGASPEPELDIVAARHLGTMTDEALNGLTGEELSAHIEKLKVLEVTAKEVLEYWTKRTDEKIAERETFEGVIENLVKHARKVRK